MTRDGPVSTIRCQLLHACNGILAETHLSYPFPGVNVHFSGKESTSQLNGLYLNDGVGVMMEGEHYQAIDIDFPYIATFLDQCTGHIKECPLSPIDVAFPTSGCL